MLQKTSFLLDNSQHEVIHPETRKPISVTEIKTINVHETEIIVNQSVRVFLQIRRLLKQIPDGTLAEIHFRSPDELMYNTTFIQIAESIARTLALNGVFTYTAPLMYTDFDLYMESLERNGLTFGDIRTANNLPGYSRMAGRKLSFRKTA